jgi:hypothetical protein
MDDDVVSTCHGIWLIVLVVVMVVVICLPPQGLGGRLGLPAG